MKPYKVTVKCYSGHTYAGHPESFTWQGKKYEYLKVVKSWREPGRKCFQVTTGDNETFNLCYNETQDQWLLV